MHLAVSGLFLEILSWPIIAVRHLSLVFLAQLQWSLIALQTSADVNLQCQSLQTEASFELKHC